MWDRLSISRFLEARCDSGLTVDSGHRQMVLYRNFKTIERPRYALEQLNHNDINRLYKKWIHSPTYKIGWTVRQHKWRKLAKPLINVGQCTKAKMSAPYL